MISIALRNLLGEKTRFAISVGGVAFSVMLILIILSLYQGWKIKSSEYISHVDTDLWVTQSGSADISNSASYLPESVGKKIQVIDGVAEVNKFIGRPVNFKIKNQDTGTYIVGFDTDQPVSGPQHLVSGTAKPGDGEIVIDKVLAQKRKLELGDYIDVFGEKLKVVGIAKGANMFLFQFSFVKAEEAERILHTQGITNYYLVKVKNGELSSVRNEIKKIAGVDALTSSEFVEKNRRVIDEVFLPIITVLVLISVLVGIAVIGLTIYTATVEKSREFGVIKALGGSNGQLYRIIFEQSLLSGLIGFLVGTAATYLLLWIIPYYVPVFVTYTRGVDLLLVFGLAIFMSLVASYIPVRRIASIDPALVFKS
ncbi:MAG TPA: FtsX-like permease family protein [Candidatus Saccharimonadales bacterium]|nr:FtsX-like permease family protein [Candidatus Saccharimonadales bacterium]